jgi:hypothetical protein
LKCRFSQKPCPIPCTSAARDQNYGLFVAEQKEAWARHEAFVAEQDRAWEHQKERDVVIDARIEKLVSGIGAFIAVKSGEGK